MTTYEEAGVSRQAAETWVGKIKAKLKSHQRPEVLSQIGGFGAYFVAPKTYQEPLWVATTDGVGTKLLLAENEDPKVYRGIGQDLVAMCVNDLLACRAEPLVFLDYLATGRLDSARDSFLLEGILSACEDSGCSLIGGETAEMPGLYSPGRLDLAGFAVGVLEKKDRFDPEQIRDGDILCGFLSEGFHSNGFSLIRKILKDRAVTLDQKLGDRSWKEILLRPTRLYPKACHRALLQEGVKGAVHITGGGLIENFPRVTPASGFELRIDLGSWEIPPEFLELQSWGQLDQQEAFSTWNMGLGFCAIVDSARAETWCREFGARRIGKVVAAPSSQETRVVLI